MLSERSYLRRDYRSERTSVLLWLLSAIAAGFAMQVVMVLPWFDGAAASIDKTFGLSIAGLKAGRAWILLTYPFLHSTRFLFHALGVLLAVYLLGRELLPVLGPRRFLGIYGGAVLAGGLAWAAIHWRSGAHETLIGSTGAVAALFVVYACRFPDRKLEFLLFFLFPVTIRMCQLALGFAAFAAIGLLFFEFQDSTMPFGITVASSAHLAGMGIGLLYHRYFPIAESGSATRPPSRTPLSRRAIRIEHPTAPPIAPAIPLQDEPKNLRAEADRVLDKINSHGFESLTSAERKVLADAKELLSQR